MKETRMPLAHAANLVANSDNALYGVQNIDTVRSRHQQPYWVSNLCW